MNANKLKKLLAILCCPICKGELQLQTVDYFCSGCQQRFPIVANTPILIQDARAADYPRIADDDEDIPISKHDYAPRSYELIEKFRDGLVLDLGSGGKDKYHDNVIQLDIFNFRNVDVVALGELLPFKDNSFDAVISQAVFEHLKYPDVVAMEIERVLKPAGIAKVDTAFLHPLHGYPEHYFNATLFGLRQWFRHFEVLWHGVEPYQMPWIMFDTIMDVYLHEMSEQQQQQLKAASLQELLQATTLIKQGRAEQSELSQIMLNTKKNTTEMIAAGVSILVQKQSSKQNFSVQQAEPPAVYSTAFADHKAIVCEHRLQQCEQELQQTKENLLRLGEQLRQKQQIIDRLELEAGFGTKKMLWSLFIYSKFFAGKTLAWIRRQLK